MKTAIIILDVLLLALFIWLCLLDPNDIPEQPVSYVQDIQVVITNIEKHQYYAGTVQRKVEVTVYSKEYNLTQKFTERYAGTFGNMPLWEYEKGDTIKARMITFVMESTGEMTTRYIDKLY